MGAHRAWLDLVVVIWSFQSRNDWKHPYRSLLSRAGLLISMNVDFLVCVSVQRGHFSTDWTKAHCAAHASLDTPVFHMVITSEIGAQIMCFSFRFACEGSRS